MPLGFHLCLSALLQGRFKGNHEIVTILKMHQYNAIHRLSFSYIKYVLVRSVIMQHALSFKSSNKGFKYLFIYFFTEMYSFFVFGLTLTSLVKWSSQHGLLLSPPQRGSLWRYGYDTPPNYDDNGLFCGGLEVRQFLFH